MGWFGAGGGGGVTRRGGGDVTRSTLAGSWSELRMPLCMLHWLGL
jgi:hypothetical protein